MKSKQPQPTKYYRPREFKRNMSDLLLQRIFNLLSSGEYEIVVTTRTGGEAGYIDFENYIIYINPKIFPAEETLIHEAMHILKPNLDERSIIEMSSLVFEKLNEKKRSKLIAYIKALTSKYVGINKNSLVPTYN